MKTLRLMLLGLPLVLSGCSTLSSVNWSKAYPWNWFGSSLEVHEQGVGRLNATTPMNEEAVSDGLGNGYRLRNGMKIENGNIVHYFEALNDQTVMMTINGENGTVSRIGVMDKNIATASGVKIGMAFSDLYDKAFGACQQSSGGDVKGVICQAPGSRHISYLFRGEWRGPEGLIPPDDMLKTWALHEIIWHR